jgi:uncharacterized protein (DUF4415 family)
MREQDTKKVSRTDWERLEAMTDDEIDYSDIPPLSDEFFQRAKLYVPNSRAVVLDADVFAWFADQGQEYHALINTILRQYMKQHTQEVTNHKKASVSSS